MLAVVCEGGPYEIGFRHGSVCKTMVEGSLDFTRKLCVGKSKRSWSQVRALAKEFSDFISQKWPRYHAELRGIADGSESDLVDIVALNVRTEIAFGLATDNRDGCTNAWVKTARGTLQGQNWDFLMPQKLNLVQVTLRQPGFPTIKMITEAGMMGKIGLNSSGVGVTYNALYMRGARLGLPSHLAMRMALESNSASHAVEQIAQQGGMAASAYIMVGDSSTASGIEFSSKDILVDKPHSQNYIVHTNHCILDHNIAESDRGTPPPDSVARLARIRTLLKTFTGDEEHFRAIWADEEGYPTSICRKLKEGQSLGETLFSIVINHRKRSAAVTVGRPSEPDEVFVMDFCTGGDH